MGIWECHESAQPTSCYRDEWPNTGLCRLGYHLLTTSDVLVNHHRMNQILTRLLFGDQMGLKLNCLGTLRRPAIV